MKLIPLVCAFAGLAGGILSLQQNTDQVVILSGDSLGYLSPCGCTSPMMGGIRRKATAIRSLTRPGRTTLLENGGLVEGGGRQDQMKAETLAQSMAELGVAAINVGPSDATLGAGMLMQLAQLSEGRFVSSSIANPQDRSLARTILNGPFMIGGATDRPQAVASLLSDSAVSLDDAVRTLISAANDENFVPILMLQGSHESAVRIARKYPMLALIQYSSVGSPPAKLEMVGDTALATTGEHGKHIVRMEYRDGKFLGYRVVALGPGFQDDPVISRYYSAYLRRVSGEKLLDKLPRHPTAGFAGSWACTTCHPAATRTWKHSKHRIALETLKKVDHDRDPDCVSCHVVGLNSTKGFRSQPSTPHLADVGCESCHGPSLAHALRPKQSMLPKVGEKSCVGCHNPQNSPNFDFDAYWRKIAHR